MDMEALRLNAGRIIAMFKHVFHTPEGADAVKMMLYASGMAGYACHQAVKALHQPFTVVTLADGTKRYAGDALNHFLLEDRYSVLAYLDGFFEHFGQGEEKPDPHAVVRWAAQMLGTDEEKIWGIYDPRMVYPHIRECWDGIYHNMTEKFCQSPEEWPVLFAIVLQNIMVEVPAEVPRRELYETALECALIISKMDEDSL